MVWGVRRQKNTKNPSRIPVHIEVAVSSERPKPKGRVRAQESFQSYQCQWHACARMCVAVCLKAGGWRGLHMAKTRVTFGRGPDVIAGAGTGHRSARMSRWEGAPATLRSGPVGGSAFFP